jgi:hypothetical protein
MSAPRISENDVVAAFDFAEVAGRSFAVMRRKSRHTEARAAKALGIRVERLRTFEDGKEKNIKLGSLVKMLGFYDLGIAVVRRTKQERAS